MVLPVEDVKRIALDVAEGIFGAPNVVSLDVSAGPDWSGDIVHFLEFTLLQDRDRDAALAQRLRLRRSVLERLAAAGDDMYPHVRIHNRVSAPAVVDPHDLVEAARALISGAAPGEAALRRAVSTAYYALFHALAGFAADRLIAPRDSSAAYALVYRGLDHKRIKDVFEDVAKPTLRSVVQRALARTTISPELRGFAETFVPMQQLRHIADYHPEFSMSLSDVGDLIDDVENALGVLPAIDRGELTDVVAYMLVGARG